MVKTKVLIIGAGPTGLMAACQLIRFGIDFIIIDRKEGPTKESRALVVHARSLEIYDQMGIAGNALKMGELVKGVQILVNGRKVKELELENIGEGLSKFPFLLVLEQNKNEELLYEYIKNHHKQVQWQTEMVGLHQETDKVLITCKTQNNETFQVQADWLIAADGSKSEVRHLLDLKFEGDTYEHIFYVADTALEGEWSHQLLSIYLTKETFLVLFPMQGQNRFRAIGILPKSFQDEHPQNFETIIPFIQQQIELPLKFHDTNWFSVYRLHHRCVNLFKVNRVFLAGDAAHIHSPAGGQGMNTGLQDAYNIAWKLAMVINDKLNEHILDTYQQERLPFAKQLLKFTDRLFDILTSDEWRDRFFRLQMIPNLLPIGLSFENIRKAIFKRVSQIYISYHKSKFSVNQTNRSISVRAGDRFPYLLLSNGESCYNLMKNPSFYVLVFNTSRGISEIEMLKGSDLYFQKLFELIIIDRSEQAIYHQLKIHNDTIVVVRPDHYIGLITDKGGEEVLSYFKELQVE